VVSGQSQIPEMLPFAAQSHELGGVGGSEIVTEAVEELDVLIEDDPSIVEVDEHGDVFPSGVCDDDDPRSIAMERGSSGQWWGGSETVDRPVVGPGLRTWAQRLDHRLIAGGGRVQHVVH